jgi:hypothetical protein
MHYSPTPMRAPVLPPRALPGAHRALGSQGRRERPLR